ncbi:hypothetical protein Godav_019869, partial [Gossypium davidsonii]|nr:hypothetical protein [Gossypium davidsonii]MBA0642588.1 hypothetical protein [Gossypium klotzschianum]
MDSLGGDEEVVVVMYNDSEKKHCRHPRYDRPKSLHLRRLSSHPHRHRMDWPLLINFPFGLAAGLKRDPVVILRIQGEDLLDFINGPNYEAEMVSVFSQIGLSNDASLYDIIIKAMEKLTVMSKIVELALQLWDGNDQDEPVCKETFLEEFKKVAKHVAQNLVER